MNELLGAISDPVTRAVRVAVGRSTAAWQLWLS